MKKISKRDFNSAVRRGMEISNTSSFEWASDEQDFIAACEAQEVVEPQPSIAVIDGVEICRECGNPEHSGYCMWA